MPRSKPLLYSIAKPTLILDVAVSHACTGGGGHETVSSDGTALGSSLSTSPKLRVSSGGVAISTTEIGAERGGEAAIPPGERERFA
jgi:autotransporter passenger strand-loop-strand repeat protein